VSVATAIEHGTTHGYRQHMRQHIKACEKCKDAMQEHRKNYRQANKEAIRLRDARRRARHRHDRRMTVVLNRVTNEWIAAYKLRRWTNLPVVIDRMTDARDTLFTMWELAATMRRSGLRQLTQDTQREEAA
jgi:hypothetical protein